MPRLSLAFATRILLGVAAGLGGLLAAAAAQPAEGPAARAYAPDASALLGRELEPGRYPGEDAVILFAGDYYILHDDGRIDHGIHRVVRLNSELAVDAFGDPRVPYDTLRQELVVHTCRTFTPDGRIVETGERAYNLVTADAVARCPAVMSEQELVITHLGVERGCVVEWDVEIRDLGPRAPWLEATAWFQMEHPVKRRVVTVKCPAGTSVQGVVRNGDLEALEMTGVGERGEMEGARIYVWRGEELPAARESDDRAGGRLTRTHLLITSCRGWDAFAERVRADVLAAATVDAEMEAWVARTRFAGEQVTARDWAHAVLALTGEQSRDASVAPFARYRAPRPAPRTFDSRCGSLWDRAVLALALLRAGGVEADLRLVAAGPEPVRSLPALAQFDRVWLALREPGGPDCARAGRYVCDPARGEFVAYGEARRRPQLELHVRPGGGVGWTREPSAQLPEATAQAAIGLTITPEGGIAGTLSFLYGEVLGPGAAPHDPQAWLAARAAAVCPGAELEEIAVAETGPYSSELRATFRAPAVGEAQGDYRYLAISAGGEDALAPLAAYDLEAPVRSTPLHLPARITARVRWQLEVPADWQLVAAPAGALIENEVGRFQARVRVESPPAGQSAAAARLLVVERDFALAQAVIAPAAYPYLRELVRHWRAEAGRLVILRRSQTGR